MQKLSKLLLGQEELLNVVGGNAKVGAVAKATSKNGGNVGVRLGNSYSGKYGKGSFGVETGVRREGGRTKSYGNLYWQHRL